MVSVDFKISEWMPFISKILELLVGGVIYIFVIDNFLLKTYVPGELLYPVDPCSAPYVTDTKSNNPYKKINPFEKADQAEAQRIGSKYQFCNKDASDLIKEFGKNNKEIKDFLYNVQKSSMFDFTLFYDTFRDMSKDRAGKIEYHGVINEIFLTLTLIYFKSTIQTRQILKSLHNIVGSLDLKNVYVFSFLFFISMSVYYAMTQSAGADIPWYNFILKIPIAIMTIFGSVILLSLFTGALFFITNFINTFINLPVTSFFTGIVTLPLVVSFVFAAIQTLVFLIQASKQFMIDPIFNGRMRNIAICDIYNYEMAITVILILFSIINALVYLNSQNLGIYMTTIFMFVIYKMFLAKKSPGASQECQKQEKFLNQIRDMNDSYNNVMNNMNNGNSNSNSPKNE